MIGCGRCSCSLAGSRRARRGGGLHQPPGAGPGPYARRATGDAPGDGVRHYATTLVLDGYAIGVDRRDSHDGRPTKLDGNPAHPATRGGSRRVEQAARPRCSTIRSARAAISAARARRRRSALARRRARGRAGWLVMPPTSSRTVARLLARVRARCRSPRRLRSSPLARDRASPATARARARSSSRSSHSRAPAVVASLDADWLSGDADVGGAVARRRRRGARPARARAGCGAGSRHTDADRRARRPRDRGRGRRRRGGRGAGGGAAGGARRAAAARPADLVGRARDRLGERAGLADAIAATSSGIAARARSSSAIGSRRRCTRSRAAINAACGNAGATVGYTDPAVARDGEPQPAFADALRGGRVGTAIVVDCNPAYTAPRRARGCCGSPSTSIRTSAVERRDRGRVRVAGAARPRARGVGRRARVTTARSSIAQPVIGRASAATSVLETAARSSAATTLRRATSCARPRGTLDATAWRRGARDRRDRGHRRAARAVAPRPDGVAAIAGELRALLRRPPAVELDRIAPAPSRLHDGRFAEQRVAAGAAAADHEADVGQCGAAVPRDRGRARRRRPATSSTLAVDERGTRRRCRRSSCRATPTPRSPSSSATAAPGDEPIADGVGAYAYRAGAAASRPLLDVTPRGTHRELAITQRALQLEDRVALGRDARGPARPRVSRRAAGAPDAVDARGDPAARRQWAMTIDDDRAPAAARA